MKKNQYNNTHSTQISAVSSQEKHALSNRFMTITCLMLCLAVLTLTGCATSGQARTGESDTLASKPIYQVAKAGDQCHYLNQEISGILEYAKKFNRSQYAYYYRALSREKLLAIETRAKQADCKYLTMPSTTRLHNIASL